MGRSIEFYGNKLGFAVEFIYGDPPYYGQVIRDNARLALRLVFEPVFVGDVRKREHLLSASITVGTANEIKQLFLSYQAAGVSFHQASLKKEPWGARTFIVSDPDENLILFAGSPTELSLRQQNRPRVKLGHYPVSILAYPVRVLWPASVFVGGS